MKRTYFDLHLCPDTSNSAQLTSVINKAYDLGYKFVGLPFSEQIPEQHLKQVQETCKDNNVEPVSRMDLDPRSPEELLRSLRRLRRKFEVIAVLCYSKAVARQAAKDRRVDLLNFPQPDFRKTFFDAAEAELASNCLASLEIDVKPVFRLEGHAMIRFLSVVRKEVEVAKEFEVPIVVSSGVSEQLLMRKPVELAALASLFGLHGEAALGAVSNNPAVIVKRNREKLNWRFVAPGIRIVRRGKDC